MHLRRKKKKIFFTDEETEYSSSELNGHGPAVVGWRCKANSTLSPKEIIIRFEKPAVVCRIQVLAHQYMIRKCKLPRLTKIGYIISTSLL